MKRFLLILSTALLFGAFQSLSAQQENGEKKKFRPIVSCGLCFQKAIYLPKPAYPKIALFVKASGNVAVQILIDETGNVIEADAVDGHSFLRAESVRTALKAKFAPIRLGGKPIRAWGVIVYKFILER